MTDTPMTPYHNRPVCTQAAARAAGLDVAPSPEELRAVSESIVSLWGDRWAEPDDTLASIADSGAQLARVMPLVLDEVDRLRKSLSDAANQVAKLESDLGEASAHTHFLERNTLPDLRREVERHRDGKARWRGRAEKAEARVVELEAAPVDEAADLAEGLAGLEAMRAEHPAPCRVPDAPDCTCPSAPRDLRPGADTARRMIRARQNAEETP